MTGVGVPAVAPLELLAATNRVAPDAVVTTRAVPVVECDALIALTFVPRLFSAVM